MRLIDADELVSELKWLKAIISYHERDRVQDFIQRVLNAPTIEAEPVMHGRWIVKNGRIVCDQCEALWAVCPNKDVQEEEMKMVYKTEKFCYNCGAKMCVGAE